MSVGYYVYKGSKPHVEPDPAETHPANARLMKGRSERRAEYDRLRTVERLDKYEAADRLGLARTTRDTYEREFLRSQESQL